MTWRKSSYSAKNGACVEVRRDLSTLRDSKNPAGPALSTPSFQKLVRYLKVH